ncbi:MAG: PhoH family protein, partial [Methylococcales bacterium]|nr:PhoH family protein [Methylococcales bacterium]
MSSETLEFTLEPVDNQRLANVCGQFNRHLHQIEQRLNVEIANRGNQFTITGLAAAAHATEVVLQKIFSDAENEEITPEQIHLSMQEASIDELVQQAAKAEESAQVFIKTRRGVLKGRGENQRSYLKKIISHDINFGVGPAGTGKTYLAVACAVEALQTEQVRRIVLVRPAVEAGEKLGFLPGDMAQKVDPYLRPLYDALYEMLGFERAEKLIERKVIEVAPLAFMRGRTLND